ncbi:hypothetical protein GE21DRAFT_1428, partial [Neurospora crassa]
RQVRAWMGAPGDARGPGAPQAPVVGTGVLHGTITEPSKIAARKIICEAPQKFAWTPRTPSGAGGHLGDFGDPRISMRDTHLGSPTVEPETPHSIGSGAQDWRFDLEVEAGKHEDGGRRSRSGPRQPGSGTRRKRFVLLCALDPLSATIDAVPWLEYREASSFVRQGQKSKGWMMAESREPELGSRTLRDDLVLSWPDARVLRLTAVSSIGRPSRLHQTFFNSVTSGHASGSRVSVISLMYRHLFSSPDPLQLLFGLVCSPKPPSSAQGIHSPKRVRAKSSIVRAIMDPLCGVLVPLGPHCDSVCTPVGSSLSETPEENPRSHALSASMLPGIIRFGRDWCTEADAMAASSILKGSLYQTRYMNNSQPPTGKCGSQGLQNTNG